MPEDDLTLLTEAARAAGEIALAAQADGFETWDKGGGQGPVTEADLAIDRMLRAELLAARPDYGWLSEESEDDPARLAAERVFIIDPIDGTRAFAEGRPSFSHALAVAEKGRVIAAVVHLPAKDVCYAATKGGGAAANGVPIGVSAASGATDADILAGTFNMAPEHWHGGAPPAFRRHMRPSLAYRMGLVAEGRFDGMLTLRATWEWDVAAGALLVEEAGGVVSLPSGQKPVFNGPGAALTGLVAAGRALHSDLVSRLAA